MNEASSLVLVDSTYENVTAPCPQCAVRNVYNRESDLRNLRPVVRASVACEACKQAFAICGDLINPAHQMLLLDCGPLIEGKHYMQAALGIAQAYEVFFSHYLYVTLIYRPFARDGGDDLERLGRLKELVYKTIERKTFEPMRQLVLRLIVEGCRPKTLAEAEAAIASLGAKDSVRRAEVEAVATEPRRTMMLGLFDTTVHTLRNKVVHKEAYRPTREETRTAYEDTSRILFGLTEELGLGGTEEHYINGGDDG